jgi:glutamyl-tRNA synthetase
LAWLRARSQGGVFLLRVEDLDAPRVQAGSWESIREDLAWLGLDWDLGPGREGGGPECFQSARLAVYDAAFERLKRAGRLFPCTCSRAEIQGAASAPHGEDAPPYPGFCRKGPSHPGRPEAWRFRMDVPEPFDDACAGPQRGLADDFVVRRSDGVYAYQLACALDDRDMGVTEVVRGDDLLGSASRQIALFKAWGAEAPHWFHVPLLLGEDGRRLSKRHGSTAVADYRAAGWSPGAVLGLLASTLGLAGPGEASSLKELLGRFDPARLPRGPQRFTGPWPGNPPSGITA